MSYRDQELEAEGLKGGIMDKRHVYPARIPFLRIKIFI